jgi:peptidoglycan biosynthesis protein MviN/MurJ (putative lipid II flippase)
LCAAANLVVAVGYQWVPVAALGAGPLTDALFVSAVVPQTLVSIASTGLTSVLTPQLSIVDEDGLRVRAWTSAVAVACGGAIVTGLLLVTALFWTRWLAPGFDAAGLALTVGLVRIQLVAAFFALVLAVLWAAANARSQFLRIEVYGIVAGGLGLAGAWLLLPWMGIAALAWASVVRAVLQVALLTPSLGRYTSPRWPAAGGRWVWGAVLPLAGGTLYGRLDPLADRVLASFAPPGHLSLLHLAQQAVAAGLQILTRVAANPLLPPLARQAARREWIAFRATSRERLVIVLALAASGWLLMALAGRPALRWALAPWVSGAQGDLLHTLLVALGGVWIGGAAGQVLGISFYAYGDTMTPTRIGVVGLTLGLPLKVLGAWWGGVVGLALATSVYTAGNALAQASRLARDLATRSRAGSRT